MKTQIPSIEIAPMMQTRRTFIMSLGMGTTAVLAAQSMADERPTLPLTKLKEDERTARIMGYKEDATKVNVKKHPKYKPGQQCENCFLYNGKAGDKQGRCTAMYRIVVPTGWCKVHRARTP